VVDGRGEALCGRLSGATAARGGASAGPLAAATQLTELHAAVTDREEPPAAAVGGGGAARLAAALAGPNGAAGGAAAGAGGGAARLAEGEARVLEVLRLLASPFPAPAAHGARAGGRAAAAAAPILRLRVACEGEADAGAGAAAVAEALLPLAPRLHGLYLSHVALAPPHLITIGALSNLRSLELRMGRAAAAGAPAREDGGGGGGGDGGGGGGDGGGMRRRRSERALMFRLLAGMGAREGGPGARAAGAAARAHDLDRAVRDCDAFPLAAVPPGRGSAALRVVADRLLRGPWGEDEAMLPRDAEGEWLGPWQAMQRSLS
jgi:hypothetical protein